MSQRTCLLRGIPFLFLIYTTVVASAIELDISCLSSENFVLGLSHQNFIQPINDYQSSPNDHSESTTISSTQKTIVQVDDLRVYDLKLRLKSTSRDPIRSQPLMARNNKDDSITLFTSTDYVMQVVGSDRPFLGGLIEIQMNDENQNFIFLPDNETSITANDLCASNSQAIVHNNFDTLSTKKYMISSGNLNFDAILSTGEESFVTTAIVNVTVFVFENNFELFFARETFHFNIVNRDETSDDQNADVTTESLSLRRRLSGNKSKSRSSTIETTCNVCGKASMQVSDPDRKVLFHSFILTCGQLQEETMKATDFLFTTVCYEAQRTAIMFCGCTEIEAADPFDSMFSLTIVSGGETQSGTESSSLSRTAPTPTYYMAAGGLDSYPTPAVTTFEPTITAIPTISPLPTYIEKCYVCGSSDSRITAPGAMVIVYNRKFSCSEIEDAGLLGIIEPGDVCNDYITAILQHDVCNCQKDQDQFLAMSLMATLNRTLEP